MVLQVFENTAFPAFQNISFPNSVHPQQILTGESSPRVPNSVHPQQILAGESSPRVPCLCLPPSSCRLASWKKVTWGQSVSQSVTELSSELTASLLLALLLREKVKKPLHPHPQRSRNLPKGTQPELGSKSQQASSRAPETIWHHSMCCSGLANSRHQKGLLVV